MSVQMELNEGTAARRRVPMRLFTSNGTSPDTGASDDSIVLAINSATSIVPDVKLVAIESAAGMYYGELTQSNLSVLGTHPVYHAQGDFHQHVATLQVVNSNPFSTQSNVNATPKDGNYSAVTVRVHPMAYSGLTVGAGDIAPAAYSGVTVRVDSSCTVAGVTNSSAWTVAGVTNSSAWTIAGDVNSAALINALNDIDGTSVTLGDSAITVAGVTNVSAWTVAGVTNSSAWTIAGDTNTAALIGALNDIDGASVTLADSAITIAGVTNSSAWTIAGDTNTAALIGALNDIDGSAVTLHTSAITIAGVTNTATLIGALNNIDGSEVTLHAGNHSGATIDGVLVTTTNTDMVGTNGANTTVPDAAGTAATLISAVTTDTENIQSRLPAALVGGRIDSDMGAISTDATAANNLEAAFDGTGYDSALTVLTSSGGGAPTAADNADAVWDEALSGHRGLGTFGLMMQPASSGSRTRGGTTSVITLGSGETTNNDFHCGNLINFLYDDGSVSAGIINAYNGSDLSVALVMPLDVAPSAATYWIQPIPKSSLTVDSVLTVGVVTSEVSANMTKISHDGTAADNLELAFDGTGYDSKLTTLSAAGTPAATIATAVWNAASTGYTSTASFGGALSRFSSSADSVGLKAVTHSGTTIQGVSNYANLSTATIAGVTNTAALIGALNDIDGTAVTLADSAITIAGVTNSSAWTVAGVTNSSAWTIAGDTNTAALIGALNDIDGTSVTLADSAITIAGVTNVSAEIAALNDIDGSAVTLANASDLTIAGVTNTTALIGALNNIDGTAVTLADSAITIAGVTNVSAEIAALNNIDGSAVTLYAGTHTGAVIPTVTAVTNEVTADMAKISGDATAANNLEAAFDGTGYDSKLTTLTVAGASSGGSTGLETATEVWNMAVADYTSTASFGGALSRFSSSVNQVSADMVAISSGITAASNLEAAFDGTGYNSALTVLTAASSGGSTSAEIATAVWNAAVAGYTSGASFGGALSRFSSSVDSVGLKAVTHSGTTIQGVSNYANLSTVTIAGVTNSTALIGALNDIDGSAVTLGTSAFTIAGVTNVSAEIAALNDIDGSTVTLADSAITVAGVTNSSAWTIAGVTNITAATLTADDIWDEVIAGTSTARELQRGYAATLLGKSSGLSTGSPIYRDIADSMNVVTASTDSYGNRSAITLDLDDTA